MKGSVAITVRQLVDTPHLRTRFHAGRAGGEQVINWAHTCEMPDPWHWLEPFDMLMTNGLGMPTDPDEQARYLSRLADAGILVGGHARPPGEIPGVGAAGPDGFSMNNLAGSQIGDSTSLFLYHLHRAALFAVSVGRAHTA